MRRTHWQWMATLLAGLLLPSIAALAAEDKPSAPTIDERLAIVIEALNRLPDGAQPIPTRHPDSARQ